MRIFFDGESSFVKFFMRSILLKKNWSKLNQAFMWKGGVFFFSLFIFPCPDLTFSFWEHVSRWVIVARAQRHGSVWPCGS